MQVHLSMRRTSSTQVDFAYAVHATDAAPSAVVATAGAFAAVVILIMRLIVTDREPDSRQVLHSYRWRATKVVGGAGYCYCGHGIPFAEN